MWMPNTDNIRQVHNELVELFRDDEDPISPSGVKNENLLASACDRPNVGIGDTQKYKTVFDKIAALFHSLTKNHPFHNGNKRTAIVSVMSALSRNDLKFRADVSDDMIYDFVVSVTADEFPTAGHSLSIDEIVQEISEFIRSHCEPTSKSLSSMRVNDFLSSCAQAGARVRKGKGGSNLVQNNKNSVRISNTTKSLSGPVVRNYMGKLGLNQTSVGFDYAEFQEGIDRERDQIYRYMAALRRLAKT